MRFKSQLPGFSKGENRLTDQQRRKWNADIVEFHAMSKGVTETWVIAADQIMSLIAYADKGVPAAKHLVDVIGQLLEHAAGSPVPVLCLGCDAVIQPPHSLPEKFIIHLPFTNPKAALANALCADCANNGTDWRERAHELLRQVFPDAYRVDYPTPAHRN
jgi:hypothetical protein